MVGVSWQGTEAQMQAFVEEHGLTFPQALDADGSLFARFGVPYQPAWVFVTAEGDSDLHVGALDASELDERLSALA